MIIFLAEKLVGPRCVQIASKRQQNLYVLFARLIHSNLYSDLQRVPVMAQQFGSVSCERSFSALRRLKLWTRFSMTEELNAVAASQECLFIVEPDMPNAKGYL